MQLHLESLDLDIIALVETHLKEEKYAQLEFKKHYILSMETTKDDNYAVTLMLLNKKATNAMMDFGTN